MFRHVTQLHEEMLSFSPESFPDSKRFYLSLIGVTYPSKSYAVKREKTDSYSLGFITSGSGIAECEGKRYTLNEGDTTLFPTGMTFQVASLPNNPQEKIWMAFSGSLCDTLYREYILAAHTYTYRLSYTGNMLQSLWDECKANRFSMEHLSLKASLLIHELFMRIAYLSTESECDKNRLAFGIKQCIDHQISRKITMSNIAEQVGLSVSYMNHVFVKVYGMTPASYYVKCRKDMAGNLLTHTFLPIGEISRQLGFSSVRYFSTWFSKEFGMCPRQYRLSN